MCLCFVSLALKAIGMVAEMYMFLKGSDPSLLLVPVI